MPDGTEWSRRGVVGLAAVAAARLVAAPWIDRADAAPASVDPHRPVLRLPARTANGARVPIVVDVPHPMEPGHHIGAVEVVNPRDPVPLKGAFHFSPTNGRAFIAFQARVDEGPSTLMAVAECGRHGRTTGTAAVAVEAGAGGCAGGPPATVPPDDIRPPVIRIPQLVADGAIAAGTIIDVQVKIKHPNRTGLTVHDGRWLQTSTPLHLASMDVFYGEERVSRFVLSSALSANPLITFKLRAVRRAPVRVTLVSTRGERFEATHDIRWS